MSSRGGGVARDGCQPAKVALVKQRFQVLLLIFRNHSSLSFYIGMDDTLRILSPIAA